MKFIDFHCDTAYELYTQHQKLDSNSLHISLNKTESCFENYAQLFAICAPSKTSDEDSWNIYLKAVSNFNSELVRLSKRIMPCTQGSDLEKAWRQNKSAAFFAVEDARILAGDMSRLNVLFDNGCRFLTLVWGGESCIGGAHNTLKGLTDFGKLVARKCFELGIVPDVSHSSEQSVDDLLDIAEAAGRPVVATHSNSYQVYAHPRNLRDRHFKKIIDLGGFVGFSLCDLHIQPKNDGHPGIDSLLRHVDHYIELGGADSIGFGCDLDGCNLPDGISDVTDIHKLTERMSEKGYSDALIEKITWKNAKNFIEKNI